MGSWVPVFTAAVHKAGLLIRFQKSEVGLNLGD